MTNDCKPPRCANVKKKCQCPNPWLEHLAHAAAERKAKGLKRLSIKQHAKEYKKTVRSGKYTAQSSQKICKSNAKLLCEWNAVRNNKGSDTSPTGPRMSEEYPPGGWDRDLLTMESPKVKLFAQNHLYITDYKGRRLVFKEFELKSVEDRREFLLRTLIHFEIHKRLGDRVPRLYKAYFLRRNGHHYGIHIMQCAPGIPLEKFLPRQTSPRVMRDLAEHFKDMFDALKKARTWHGDMHGGNWMVDVAENGSIKALTLIDFDFTVIDVDDLRDKNVLKFLEYITEEENWQYLPLLPYLREAGICIPPDILEWDTHDFERDHLHLQMMFNTIVKKMTADPDIALETISA